MAATRSPEQACAVGVTPVGGARRVLVPFRLRPLPPLTDCVSSSCYHRSQAELQLYAESCEASRELSHRGAGGDPAHITPLTKLLPVLHSSHRGVGAVCPAHERKVSDCKNGHEGPHGLVSGLSVASSLADWEAGPPASTLGGRWHSAPCVC